MTITPRPTVNVSSALANQSVPIDVTLAVTDTAEDLALVPATKRGRQLDLVNEGPGDVAIKFDGTAIPTDLLIKEGDSVSWGNLDILTKVSFINVVSGETPHLRGVLMVGAA